jgi:hypothetical protein
VYNKNYASKELKMKIKKYLLRFLFLIFLSFFGLNIAVAEEKDIHDQFIPTTPLVPSNQSFDLNGVWYYQSTNGLSGTMSIEQKGKSVTLEITSGSECRPVEVCLYSGTIDKNAVILSNSVVVDKEGGTVTSAMQLVISSDETASGTSTNHYVHPEGYEKRWDAELSLTRNKAEK